MLSKADIRNPLSLLAHERSRFATCQWELLTPTDISILLIPPRLVLYALEAGEGLFCVQFFEGDFPMLYNLNIKMFENQNNITPQK